MIGGGANPTNPAATTRSTVTNPFQAADCQTLKFAPKFAVSTRRVRRSKANGASLTVKLTYPTRSLGTEANIKEVKVELPKPLPSRLTTLQKACTAQAFDANPASCPAGIDHRAREGDHADPAGPAGRPRVLRRHGGEAFPNLVIVLQGDGVTIDPARATPFISKTGITSARSRGPRQPVESFELTLPEGPYSALAANGNLCAHVNTVTVKKKVTVKVHGRKQTVTRTVNETQSASLSMPTEFIAQNGATIHRSTPIDITNCPKAKPAKKVSKKKGRAS